MLNRIYCLISLQENCKLNKFQQIPPIKTIFNFPSKSSERYSLSYLNFYFVRKSNLHQQYQTSLFPKL